MEQIHEQNFEEFSGLETKAEETGDIKPVETITIPERVLVDPPKAPEKKPEKNLPAVNKPNPLQADERGLLVGSTLEEQYRLATAYSKSGLMPQALNTPEKVLVALQVCHELQLPPMSSIGKIAVINGTPSLFGELPLAIVLKSNKLASIVEKVDVNPSNNEPQIATCTVKRKDIDMEITRTFSKEDAIKAGLWGKKVWAPYPKRMMQMRARSHALKDAFPDVLSGIAIAEYDHNIEIEEGAAPIKKNGSSLNEKFSKPKTVDAVVVNDDKKNDNHA